MKSVLPPLALGLALLLGASSASARPVVGVAIGVAPARVVVVRPARVWVPGYWRYSHARRVWVAGYWSHRAYRPVRRIGMPRWRVRAGYRAW